MSSTVPFTNTSRRVSPDVYKRQEKVWTKRQIPPATWNIIYGEYKESLRLCFLPADEKGEHGYWFGFESEIQKASPVFKART